MRCSLAQAARTMRGVVSVERVRVAGLEGLAAQHMADEELDGARPAIPHLRERLAVMGEIAMLLELAVPYEAEILKLIAHAGAPSGAEIRRLLALLPPEPAAGQGLAPVT